MNFLYTGLSDAQRTVAIQRLTALWAFTESGLGGIMHALQIPFTGLLVGGMAIIMICLIGDMSDNKPGKILKSALIVLIVKAMVSPYTPFPAYLAVSFQALLGYGLFKVFKINIFSILLLSTLAMIESAIQKILVLTLFFGESIWKALDSLVALLAKQFGQVILNGSYWIVGIYLLIYLAGGFFVAWIAVRTIQSFKTLDPSLILHSTIDQHAGFYKTESGIKKQRFRKLWILISMMLLLSVILFLFAADEKQGWLAVIKTISWTISAILIWYMLIGPLFSKAIQKLLQKKESRYSDEVLKTLSFVPQLKQITTLAWQQSKQRSGVSRWYFFFASTIHTALTCADPASADLDSKTAL